MLMSDIRSEIFDLPVPSRHGKKGESKKEIISLFSCPITTSKLNMHLLPPARENSMPAGNNGSVMKSSGRPTHLVDRKTLSPSRHWTRFPSFPESARTAALSPFHNVRAVAHEFKFEWPFEVPHALFDRERGGQLPSAVLALPCAAPSGAAPRYGACGGLNDSFSVKKSV
ncbi:hypothetical protein Tco_0961284 [Tanacetum coccineum]